MKLKWEENERTGKDQNLARILAASEACKYKTRAALGLKDRNPLGLQQNGPYIFSASSVPCNKGGDNCNDWTESVLDGPSESFLPFPFRKVRCTEDKAWGFTPSTDSWNRGLDKCPRFKMKGENEARANLTNIRIVSTATSANIQTARG